LFSMFLFVQLLSISAYALPTNVSALDECGFLDKLTGNDINQALSEYNRFKTVRAIPATEKGLLEGVYCTSSLDLRPDGLPSNYWEVHNVIYHSNFFAECLEICGSR
ncbi:hypothetical protein C8R41DRAFT_828334, partial [Lentinula lateritia]